MTVRSPQHVHTNVHALVRKLLGSRPLRRIADNDLSASRGKSRNRISSPTKLVGDHNALYRITWLDLKRPPGEL